LYIPDLIVSNLNETSLEGIYIGDIVPKDSTIGINGSDDNLVLSGELGSGHILVAGTTASLYYNFKSDITNTVWGKYSGPTITTLDFSLTLQGSIDIASIINSQTPISNKGGTFSGSISVPEQATFFILAFGSVLFWRKEKTA
ncbi:MAG: hypothetical protein ACO20W_10840, partial [Anaerohalosphaeraceae bacterium]